MGELAQLGVMVVAATVDDRLSTTEMAQATGLTFPIAYGITAHDVEELDPWWAEDHHGRYIQPMELLVLRGALSSAPCMPRVPSGGWTWMRYWQP